MAEPKANTTSIHPNVTALANTIEFDVRSNTEYFGPLYIGSEQLHNKVVYDTMSDWTVIVSN